MGKGDMKTKRGKIHRGSYGKRRPRHTGKAAPVVPASKVIKETTTRVTPVEPLTEEPRVKKAPVKSKSKKEPTDQPSLFDGDNAAKTE